MNAAIVFTILLASIGGYLLLARWSRGLRARLGVAAGSIVSADDSRLRAPNLYSERLGLVGRCDHLMREGGVYLPVEQKPTAQRLHDSHVLQVGALCLLIQDVYGRRPPYGIVVLAGGRQERVPFSTDLERRVRSTMGQMRRILAAGRPPGREWVAAKCCACGYHPVCWEPSGGRHPRAA
jgi:CRISPR-associated exonuclease Cas4